MNDGFVLNMRLLSECQHCVWYRQGRVEEEEAALLSPSGWGWGAGAIPASSHCHGLAAFRKHKENESLLLSYVEVWKNNLLLLVMWISVLALKPDHVVVLLNALALPPMPKTFSSMRKRRCKLWCVDWSVTSLVTLSLYLSWLFICILFWAVRQYS